MTGFRDYVVLLVRITVASSVVLGMIFGIAILISGGTTANIDLTIELNRFNGFWMVILLPVVSLLLLVLASPLSYFLFRRLPGGRDAGVEPGEPARRNPGRD